MEKAALLGQFPGAKRNVLTAAYFACFFCLGVCLAALGPILLALTDQLDTTLDAIGLLFVLRSIGYLLGSAVGGAVVDRTRRTHGLVLVALVLCAIGTAALPGLHSYVLAAMAVSTWGVAMGVLDTAMNVMLMWLWGPARGEPYMQAMHFFFGVGAIGWPSAVESPPTGGRASLG